MNQDRTLHIVLTGVHGFIGNRVLEACLKMKPQELCNNAGVAREAPVFLKIHGCDLKDTLNRFTAKRFAGSAQFQFYDHLELLEALEQGRVRADIIVHNGACSSTTETDPEIFRSLNLEYTKKLWRLCAKQQIPFLYASSASVYGNGKFGFDDHPSLLQKFEAMNLYAKSKLDFDKFTQEDLLQPPIWFGLRYFNVYGPFEGHKGGQASMVFHGFKQIMQSGEMALFKGTGPDFGDGQQMRDFLYVDDAVNLTLQLMKHVFSEDLRKALIDRLKTLSTKPGCFINVGTGQARTWNDLAACLFKSLGKETRIKYIDMPAALARQYQEFTQAKHTALSALCLEPRWTSLEAGVENYVSKFLLRNIGD